VHSRLPCRCAAVYCDNNSITATAVERVRQRRHNRRTAASKNVRITIRHGRVGRLDIFFSSVISSPTISRSSRCANYQLGARHGRQKSIDCSLKPSPALPLLAPFHHCRTSGSVGGGFPDRLPSFPAGANILQCVHRGTLAIIWRR